MALVETAVRLVLFARLRVLDRVIGGRFQLLALIVVGPNIRDAV